MKIIIKGACPNWNQVITATARHWGAKKAIFDEWKEIVKWTIYQIPNKPELPFKKKVELLFLVEYKDKRSRDVDGVCLKPLLDSLVDSGVLKDDSVKFIDTLHIKLVIGTEDKITINVKEKS